MHALCGIASCPPGLCTLSVCETPLPNITRLKNRACPTGIALLPMCLCMCGYLCAKELVGKIHQLEQQNVIFVLIHSPYTFNITLTCTHIDNLHQDASLLLFKNNHHHFLKTCILVTRPQWWTTCI